MCLCMILTILSYQLLDSKFLLHLLPPCTKSRHRFDLSLSIGSPPHRSPNRSRSAWTSYDNDVYSTSHKWQLSTRWRRQYCTPLMMIAPYIIRIIPSLSCMFFFPILNFNDLLVPLLSSTTRFALGSCMIIVQDNNVYHYQLRNVYQRNYRQLLYQVQWLEIWAKQWVGTISVSI